jgi:LPS sulfotransferase NodH
MKNELSGLFSIEVNNNIPMRIRKLTKSRRNYAICMTPRSGSTLLTNMLRSTNLLGNPEEWFNADAIGPWVDKYKYKVKSLVEYIDCLRRHQKTPNGIFGCELPYYQMIMLLELVTIQQVFDDEPIWFYLRRKNLILQGISLFRSAKSGYFHSYMNNDKLIEQYMAVEYSSEEIQYWIQHILEQEIGFEEVFENYKFEPIRIFYEEFIEKINRKRILNLFFNALGISQKIIYSEKNETIKKISDEKNLVWHKIFITENRNYLREMKCKRPKLY